MVVEDAIQTVLVSLARLAKIALRANSVAIAALWVEGNVVVENSVRVIPNAPLINIVAALMEHVFQNVLKEHAPTVHPVPRARVVVLIKHVL